MHDDTSKDRAATVKESLTPQGQTASVPAPDLTEIAQRSRLETLMTDLAEAVFYRDVDKIPSIRNAILAAASPQAPQPAQADAFQRAIEVRAAQGWKIDGGPVPVLYTDTINEQQVCRDDVWLCKTEHLKSKGEAAPQPEAQPHMVQALKDAIEGECDGLAITDAHAKAILEYVLAAPSAQAEQPICGNCDEPAPGCGGLFASDGATCEFHGKAQAEPQHSQAALDVLAERQRQITAEGWTPEHDDEHSFEEMAFAASCYACADEGEAPPAVWPWDWKWWKPKSRRRNLVKAGALILAEIERLDRKAQAEQKGGE